jgi:hypothetical protein
MPPMIVLDIWFGGCDNRSLFLKTADGVWDYERPVVTLEADTNGNSILKITPTCLRMVPTPRGKCLTCGWEGEMERDHYGGWDYCPICKCV